MQTAPIRVLLAHHSPLALKNLRAALASAPEIAVVGATSSGREALRLVETMRPQVLLCSAQLSSGSGLELARDVMARVPTPILVLGEGAAPLLEAGAVDACETGEAAPLLAKIRRLSRVPVISRSHREGTPSHTASSHAAPSPVAPGVVTAPAAIPLAPKAGEIALVAIGASTGGPQALLSVLGALPRHYGLPILCVQHISKGFLGELVTWLDGQCALKVGLAQSGEVPAPGQVYFPAEDHHLELDGRGRLVLSASPPRGGHRPSVTLTFEAMARVHGPRGAAVLLTGMGSDGAPGLRAVRDAGGVTIAQNEGSCVVFGMPKAAIELGAAQFVLAPGDIARKLLALAP